MHPFLLARSVSAFGVLRLVYCRNQKTFKAVFEDFLVELFLACRYYLCSSYSAWYWYTNPYSPLPSSSSSLFSLFIVLNRTTASASILSSTLILPYQKWCCQRMWTRNFILVQRWLCSWWCPSTPSRMVSTLDSRPLIDVHCHSLFVCKFLSKVSHLETA